jgi:MoxR-like ATPase
MDSTEVTSPKEIRNIIHNATPPENYKIKDLKWKHLLRSILRGKNVMFIGHSGCGKTEGAYQAAQYLDRELVRFNIGSMQDPRSALIGTREADDGSTYFHESEFVRAIQREDGPVILLDELTRGGHEAWNILMTVLDEKQRYLRLDEDDSEGEENIVRVHPSVSFIATANIGSAYTATRALDRAVEDRFTYIETDLLDDEEEFDLLKTKFPDVDENALMYIAKVANDTRREADNESSILDRIISTRQTIEMAELVRDGFSFHEAAELLIYPLYDDDMGEDSERSKVEKIVERYEDVRVDEDFEDIFTDEEIQNAPSI